MFSQSSTLWNPPECDDRGVPIDDMTAFMDVDLDEIFNEGRQPPRPIEVIDPPQLDLLNRHYNTFLQNANVDPDAARKFLEKVVEVKYDPRKDEVSRLALALVTKKRRVRDLYDTLREVVYLPSIYCKRLTYTYLLGIMEEKYLAVQKSKITDIDVRRIKASSKEIMFEIEFIALASGFKTGFDLARPFPKEFYARMLYALCPDSAIFGKRLNKLLEPVGEAPDVNIDELLDKFYKEMPLPDSFRGLIRYDKARFKVQMASALFGGEKGVLIQRKRFADFVRASLEMFRAIKTMKKRISELNGCVMFTDPALQHFLN